MDTAVKALKDAGHEVTVSDLYAQKFNNTPSKADVTDGVQNKETYDYTNEMNGAYRRGTLPADILAEHKKLDAADLVIFQFPMHWYTWPAMLKGWMDRVMVNGYAFSYYPEMKIFDSGVFRQKKAILSITTGGPTPSYSETGLHGSMSVFLWPLHMTLYHMGFQILRPQCSFGVPFVGEDQRKAYLADWARRLASISSEKPLTSFFGMADYDASKGFALKDDVVQARKAKDAKAPNVGQTLGLPPKTPWQDGL